MIRAVEKALEGRADYFDIRYTNVTSTNLEMKNKDVTRAIAGSEEGACVRVLYKGAWGFASAPELTEKSLADTADRAALMAKGISESIKVKSSLAPVEPAREEVEIPMRKSFLDK